MQEAALFLFSLTKTCTDKLTSINRLLSIWKYKWHHIMLTAVAHPSRILLTVLKEADLRELQLLPSALVFAEPFAQL